MQTEKDYHQNVSDHLHRLVVVVPAELNLPQKAFPLSCFDFQCNRLQVVCQSIYEACVQPVTKFVDDHVVCVPA